MAKETKEVVEFLLSLGQAGALAAHDGEITLLDAQYFFESVRRIGPALGDISKITDELAAWTDADTEEMKALADEFDIPQDNIEAIVRDAIKIAAPLVEFLARFRSE